MTEFPVVSIMDYYLRERDRTPELWLAMCGACHSHTQSNILRLEIIDTPCRGESENQSRDYVLWLCHRGHNCCRESGLGKVKL